jgi:hypothetical protein
MNSALLRDPFRPPAKLSPGSQRILRALAAALAPSSDASSRSQDCAVEFVSTMLPYMATLSRWLLPLGLLFFELGTWLFFFSWRPFSRLPLARQRLYARSWMHSRLAMRRQLFLGLRSLALIGYYDQPEVYRDLGYDPGPFIAERQAARRQRYAQQGRPLVVEPHAAGTEVTAPPARRGAEQRRE